MAACAALVSLATAIERILDYDPRHVFLDEKEEITSLYNNIIFLLTFLEDFPGEVGNSEERITIAANEAADIIEFYIFYEIGSECGMGFNWKTLCEELEKSIKDIHSVVDEAILRRNSKNQDLTSTHSLSSRIGLVGFEEELMKIKGRLCGEPSRLQVIPIVGMGGIGKTTLARYAHDDPLTVHHFDVRAWVTVSQNYHIHAILLSILNSISTSTKGRDTSSGTESLVQRVYQYLKGRRYLIVIDDIWNASVWDDVQRVFPDDINGSRIIMTTRDLDVASYVASSCHPHEMQLMTADQSWNLLKQKMFGQEICPPDLEKIGKQIAEKCKGLPLAIAVIAGVLSKVNQMQETWKSIARNVNDAVNTSDEPFADILSLSYAHLPHHLRPCFLYMGGFPEDYEINVSKLVKLWAADDFLKSMGSKDLEEVAEDYLEDLAKRSLLLINKKRYNGKIKTIKIHDLLRDLCLRKARDEKFLQDIDEFSGSFPEGIESSRRLSIFSNIRGDLPNIDGSCIQTILLFYDLAFGSWKSFRLLRVVDGISFGLRLHPDKFPSCPDEVGELLHLRYLAVTFVPPYGLRQYEVPESWSKLQNLQTLIISNSELAGTSYLPYGIWRMPQLRHVIMSDGFFPHPSAETNGDQILALENLHTLKGIRLFTCSERILELIPNLKRLGIDYSHCYTDRTGWSQFCLNNLVHLHKLEKLNFCAESEFYLPSNLSENIAFPVTLKKLTLTGSKIPWEDMSIVGSLPNLQVLKLKRRACVGTKWETIEGEFCELKVLLIDSADLHHWITESSHFPRLERLLLYDCNNLTEIPYGIGEIPTLEFIEVDIFNFSIVESAKSFEEEQQSFGNDLQVHIKFPPLPEVDSFGSSYGFN